MLVDEETEAQLYMVENGDLTPTPCLLAGHPCISHPLHLWFSQCGPEAAAASPGTSKSEIWDGAGLLCLEPSAGRRTRSTIKPFLRSVKCTCPQGRRDKGEGSVPDPEGEGE